MTKPKKKQKAIPGPLLAAALFCEQTVEGSDKAISCIRIADTMNVQLPPEIPADLPSEEKRMPVAIRGFISFRRGGARGKHHQLKLVMVAPNGKSAVMAEQRITFSPEAYATANLRFETVIGVYQSGVFWLIVNLDGKEYTRVPLNIVISRQPASDSGKHENKP
jgi:hypothetical protein